MSRARVHKIGTKPFSGSRFVQDGKVRIEWWPGGKRRLLTIGRDSKATREQADRELTEALAAARAGAEVKAARAPVTMGHLLRVYNEDATRRINRHTGQKLRPTTLHHYAEYAAVILAFFGVDRAAESVARRDVKDFMRNMATAGKGQGVISRTVEYLRAAYRWAVADEELLLADPIAGVKVPGHASELPPYTRDEARRLYDALMQRGTDSRGRKLNDWRFRTMALLVVVYGVREQQARRLAWADVDFDKVYKVEIAGESIMYAGTVTFRKATPGSKGQKDRTVPMLPVVHQALVEALNHRNKDVPSQWVIPKWDDTKEPVTYEGMQRALHALEGRCGVMTIVGRAWHSLRRSMMTVLVEELGPAQAAAFTGDTPAVIMRTYVKTSPEAMVESARVVEKLFPAPKPRHNRDSVEGAEIGREVSA